MTYTSSTRDRYRLAVSATTAAVAAGAMTATGWMAGAAAQDYSQTEARKQAEQDQRAQEQYAAWVAENGDRVVAQRPRVVLRQRPTKTRSTTRYVTAAGTSASVGPGGTVSNPVPSTSQSSSQSSSQTSSSNAGQQTSTQQPPPPPATAAPTNGS